MHQTDKALLELLQRDASLSVSALAERVGISKTACWRRIKALERTLCDDGLVLIKVWFHLPRSQQARRLKQERDAKGKKAKEARKGKRWRLSPLAKRFAKHYDDFVAALVPAAGATAVAAAVLRDGDGQGHRLRRGR